ncbi:MAG: Threonine-tRNA ligase [Candidatus Woesebacteria bacterium GW2011_GWB1_45_5]|uniref:Threonine--tRNA ligase n=1 Tax=Candidatus Woesebacteria bacterium GW2011_GWB1_45_5 TaxID=1618581 RepID=A0A0G1MNF9_9BACT|nr:MAG: Threonine-tRNA ligase [Candidatus Woesebacteria bacterium GW2011_GWB1_45_5]
MPPKFFFDILKTMKNDVPQEKDWDHKKLGRELDLFTFSDVVGKGLPLWTPKGAAIRREIERFIVDEEIKRGYSHVYTPDIAKLELYKKSGHYPYYKESMYAPIKIEDEEFMLRPMTCPHHFELFLDKPRSYRELPIRYAELAKLYRFEKSGELMGLQRVRSFCLADAHIICKKSQAGVEINSVLDLIDYFAKILGLKKDEDYNYRLSLGDRADEKKYFKDDKSWDYAEDILRQALKKRKSKFVEAPGEAAFYGPKIDIQMVNANGKEDTAFTVQYDFVMSKRFKLEYINEEGKMEEAVVVHRSSVGAIERVIAFLIEKSKGNFPTWLTPVQVKVLPITEKHLEYANRVVEELQKANIRVELDDRNERLQAKIRDAQLEKVAYMFIVGDKEADAGTVSVRKRNGDDLGSKDLGDFLKALRKEIEEKIIN